MLLPQLFLKARRRRLRGGAAAGSGAVRRSRLEAEDALVFEDGVAVGHAGEVIADGAGPAFVPGAFAGEFADLRRVIEVVTK